MKMNRQTLLLLLAIALLSLFSCKTAKLSDAIAKEERGEYFDAAKVYRKVYSKTPSKKTYLRGSIAYHLAECYRKSGATQKALTAYNNALRYEYPDSSSVLFAAKMLHRLGRYKEASKKYQEFLDSVPDNIQALNGLRGCDSAVVWKGAPTRYEIKKFNIVSTRDGDFSPVLLGDKSDMMIYSTSRRGVVGDSLKSSITGIRNNDFYLLKQDEKGVWRKPEHIDSELNTEFDEGSSSVTANGSTLYYTYCGEEEGIPKTADIYRSPRSGAQWGKGERVAIFEDTLKMAAHPAVGMDGYLYFVSDVIGGYGGKDIWRVKIDETGKSYPENLGADINTAGDEMFPYFRDDSTLYFSSDGHLGMGGLDIFRAVPIENGWTVENLKSPINSNADDFGIVFEPKKNRGYFCSNRNDGRGSDHIYQFELPGYTIAIEGWVLDNDEEMIDGASVRIVGKDGSNRKVIAKVDGTWKTEIVKGMEYVMLGSAPEHLNQKQMITIPDEEKSDTFYVDFYLPSISKPVVIENIFYDFDRATLRPESKEALDEIIAMLEDNPNVTIELSAHTDRKGSDEYNQNLSQHRAKSVVDYLISAGIEKDRLTSAGYGKSKPKTVTKYLASQFEYLPYGQILDEEFINTLIPEQQEIADQINRRTEFKVLRTNYRLF
ncbi:MAG: OmpA family protein [Dysgonamonadaceae bacterium]|jgi:peptidoglycan-associated lipoprotein|nr:OmpA family protein [Dysgonamonadaceae bacterium]